VQGYRQAMQAHAQETPPGWQVHCPPQVEGGRIAARELLKRAPELTALLAYNDLVAVGALRACTEMGRRVPQDCAIVGCDDVLLAALVSPALTTVHIPTYNLGRQALGLLLALIHEESEQVAPITVSPHLVIRDSSGHAIA
jgi:LacI family transcriptional regulator